MARFDLRHITAAIALIAAASATLSACGRKGGLEAAPAAAVDTTQPAPAKTGDGKFILDPLL